MRVFFERFRSFWFIHPGWLVLFAAIGLTVVGIVAIETSHPLFAAKQMQWLVIAVVVALVFLLPNPRKMAILGYPLTAFTLGLLAFVIIPGVPRSIVPVRNGTTAWINLHFMMFQPSELAKITFVIALAAYLRHRKNYRTLKGLLTPFAIMIVPVLLILKQPDMGTALLFGPTLFAMLIAAGAKLRHMGAIGGLAVTGCTIVVLSVFLLPDSMQILQSHQRKRIISMVSLAQGDNRYVRDIGYQQHKAIILAGAGGVSGYGQTKAAINLKFNNLPEDHNDMIFAVITHRWGWLGGAGTLILFLLMIFGILLSSARSKDPFARLVCVGFASILFVQMMINVGMCVGLLPIIGITFPFVSYGGSSLLVTFVMIGLVVNFASRRHARLTRPCFEFEGSSNAMAPKYGMTEGSAL
jgi:cell division protein FtsW (lipid II flippase)